MARGSNTNKSLITLNALFQNNESLLCIENLKANETDQRWEMSE